MEKTLNCKFCGEKPKFIKERKTFGHGEFPLCGHIECENCGIRTKSFIIDGFYGCTDTEDTVISVWNKLMSN